MSGAAGVSVRDVRLATPVSDGGDRAEPSAAPDGLHAGASRPRIVALGDSVTVGVGDVDEQGWAVHLAHVLGGDLVNLAANGARAHTVGTGQLACALASRPTVATVMVGGNDVLRGDFDAAQVGAAIERTLRELLAIGCTVVLVVPPPVGRALPAPAFVRRVLARRMDLVRAVTFVAVQRVSPDERLLVIDGAQVHRVGGDRVLHIDRIHPSPLGHRVLADQVAHALAARGFRSVSALPAVPAAPPLRARVWWLVVRGAPWLLRRSRDLLPQLLITVVREERASRRLRRGGGAAEVGAGAEVPCP